MSVDCGKLSFSVLSSIMDHDLGTGVYLNWLATITSYRCCQMH